MTVELPKHIKLKWKDSTHHCDECGCSSVTDIEIELGDKVITDGSGDCFGNVYDTPEDALKRVFELLGIELEIENIQEDYE